MGQYVMVHLGWFKYGCAGYGMVCYVSPTWVQYGFVPGMVLASAGGTGPSFPGATVPPDGNVANPTRPGTTLPGSRQPKKSVGDEKSGAQQFYRHGLTLDKLGLHV